MMTYRIFLAGPAIVERTRNFLRENGCKANSNGYPAHDVAHILFDLSRIKAGAVDLSANPEVVRDGKTHRDRRRPRLPRPDNGAHRAARHAAAFGRFS